MALVNAALHCSSSSIDLGSLSRFGLGEYGEEHDDPSGGGVVADSGLLAVEVEAQLAELAVELSGERFAEVDALFGEQIDVSLDLTELVVRQRIQPAGYFWFGLNQTPTHSRDAITRLGGTDGTIFQARGRRDDTPAENRCCSQAWRHLGWLQHADRG